MSSKSPYVALRCDALDKEHKITDLYKSTESNLLFGHPTRGGGPIEPKLTTLQLWRFGVVQFLACM